MINIGNRSASENVKVYIKEFYRSGVDDVPLMAIWHMSKTAVKPMDCCELGPFESENPQLKILKMHVQLSFGNDAFTIIYINMDI